MLHSIDVGSPRGPPADDITTPTSHILPAYSGDSPTPNSEIQVPPRRPPPGGSGSDAPTAAFLSPPPPPRRRLSRRRQSRAAARTATAGPRLAHVALGGRGSCPWQQWWWPDPCRVRPDLAGGWPAAGADGGGGGAGGGCGGDDAGGGYGGEGDGDDGSGPRCVSRRRPGSSRTSPPRPPACRPRRRSLHDADDPRCALHLQIRATQAGSGRLAAVAADGGGWRRWRLAMVAPAVVMVGRPSRPKGLTVCRCWRQHVEAGKETGCGRDVDGEKICGSGLGWIAKGKM
ncbi:hypothetical protein OsI_31523 [Oryza sativa Indica Group]|uniref:Uncharacterized protein n=1 Tax=Oryza sativa subsp. indica TaxID=39946 RepID=B8BCF2_ORYSI|nr:hypothetical protein OsI_31523 [Oryza sativa Indica Group]